MGKFAGGIAAVGLLFWVLYMMAATNQEIRVERFCAPAGYFTRLGGALTEVVDKDEGQKFAKDGTLEAGCRERLAPPLLAWAGLYDRDGQKSDQKPSELARPEAGKPDTQPLSPKAREITEQLAKLDTPEGRAMFTEEELIRVRAKLEMELQIEIDKTRARGAEEVKKDEDNL